MCGSGTVLPAYGQLTTLGWCQVNEQVWWINVEIKKRVRIICSSLPSINTASPRTEHHGPRFAARGELTASRNGNISHNYSEHFHI